jgi:tripartite-type tricarboxylate transporter receptor subunit TctC
MKRTSRFFGLLALLGCQVLLLPDATAQQYPAKPVRAIMPLTPGGLADVVLRALSPELSKSLGQPVVVENRPGAGMLIGSDACAKAPPDGYTICLLSVEALSIAPYVFKTVPFNNAKDFEAITNFFFLTVGLMVNPSLGVNTVQEFIALAKSKPRSMNYGSTAYNVEIFMAEFNKINGTDLTYIPYKGGGDAVNALLGNQVQALFFGVGNLMGHLKSGKLKVLAIDGTVRSPLFPNVPTLAEAGYRGQNLRAWFGFLAPAGTPKPIINRLYTDIGRVASVPAFKEQNITSLGLESVLDTPEHFTQFLKEDREKGERLIRQAGIKVE